MMYDFIFIILRSQILSKRNKSPTYLQYKDVLCGNQAGKQVGKQVGKQ